MRGKEKELNENIFVILLLITTIISGVFFLFFLFFIQTNTFLLINVLISFFLFGGMYLFVKRGIGLKISLVFYTIFSLILFTGSWIFTGGIVSGIGYYIVVATGILVIIFPKKYRLYIILLMTIFPIILFSIEFSNPELIRNFLPTESKTILLFINLISSIGLAGWLLSKTKNEYNKEKKHSAKKRSDLLKANEKKTRFIRNISHEIRTPLNGLIGMASLLENTNITEEQKEYLEIIKSSSLQLLNITNGIIDYSNTGSIKTQAQGLLLIRFSIL